MSLTALRDGSHLLGALGVDAPRVMKGLESGHSTSRDLKLLRDDFSRTSVDLTPAQLAEKLKRGTIPGRGAIRKPDARTCPCPETYAQPTTRFRDLAEAWLPRSVFGETELPRGLEAEMRASQQASAEAKQDRSTRLSYDRDAATPGSRENLRSQRQGETLAQGGSREGQMERAQTSQAMQRRAEAGRREAVREGLIAAQAEEDAPAPRSRFAPGSTGREERSTSARAAMRYLSANPFDRQQLEMALGGKILPDTRNGSILVQPFSAGLTPGAARDNGVASVAYGMIDQMMRAAAASGVPQGMTTASFFHGMLLGAFSRMLAQAVARAYIQGQTAANPGSGSGSHAGHARRRHAARRNSSSRSMFANGAMHPLGGALGNPSGSPLNAPMRGGQAAPYSPYGPIGAPIPGGVGYLGSPMGGLGPVPGSYMPGGYPPGYGPGGIISAGGSYLPGDPYDTNAILNDGALTVEDKITLMLMMIMKQMDQQIEQQANYINSLQQQQQAGGGQGGSGAPSIDVETMKLKRLIDKRSQMFDMLRQIIDKYNQTAKGIIDSMGRQ